MVVTKIEAVVNDNDGDGDGVNGDIRYGICDYQLYYCIVCIYAW